MPSPPLPPTGRFQADDMSMKEMYFMPRRLYVVAFEEFPDEKGEGEPLRTVQVQFFIPPPSGKTVDRIVCESLEHAALVNPSVDIWGLAFDNSEDALGDDQWSGPFMWEAEAKKVVRISEREKSKPVAPTP